MDTRYVEEWSSWIVLRLPAWKAGRRLRLAANYKFPSGYEYPMHVNHAYWLFAILSGTLVLGFDRQHRKSGERFLPAGTIMQGLAEEPHYGRAIGETIFEIYAPCLKR